MTKSTKRFLVGGTLIAALPLIMTLSAAHPRTQAAPPPPDPQASWRELFAQARAKAPRLSVTPPQRPAGLCGSEILPPETGQGSVPRELRDLTVGTPTSEAVAAAAKAWLVDEGGVVDVVGLTTQGAAERQMLERAAAEPIDERSEDPTDSLRRIELLLDLGRPHEALTMAERAHDRWPGFATTNALYMALEHTDRPEQARALVERELAREEHGADERSWLTAYRGFVCSRTGDRECVASVKSALDTSAAEASMSSFFAGYDHFNQGRLGPAEASYSQALELDPSDIITANNFAVAGTCLGRGDARERWATVASLAQSSRDISMALEGVGYTYLAEGDAARAWVHAAGSLASGGDGEFAREPRKLLALTALSLSDLDEARRQIQPVAGPGSERDPLLSSCYPHPAETDSLRALIAEARGDRLAAQRHWLAVARSGHRVLGLVARHALAALCPPVG